jgi:hypothetical protein
VRLNAKVEVKIGGVPIDVTKVKGNLHELKLNMQLGVGFKIDMKKSGLKKFKRVSKKRAAIMLQTAYRRKRAMKRVGVYLKQSKRLAQNGKVRIRNKGALDIQRSWRGYKVGTANYFADYARL